MYEFILDFNLDSSTPKYQQLYEYIKKEIENGHFSAGSKMPSTRNLCSHLGISRNTVDTAYDQLLAEGYLTSRERSGYFVSQDIDLSGLRIGANCRPDLSEARAPKSELPKFKFDFKYGRIDYSSFPLGIWKKAITHWIHTENHALLSYGHRQGELSLRQEISNYIRNARGVNCSPDQIVLTSGTQMSIDLICKLLQSDHKTVAVEDPGYIGGRMMFQANNYEIMPIPLDAAGINLDKLKACPARLVLITPSHQFPYGMIMPISRRLELLKWAHENDGILIENDFEGEFSYSGRPIPSLQSYDSNGRVIYLYNFSSSLLPAVRTSFLVLPPILLDRYNKLFPVLEQTVPITEQRAIEYLIAEGFWEKHIRRMKKIYSKKFSHLSDTLQEHMEQRIDIIGNKAGLHILLRVKTPDSERELIDKAKKAGIRVYPTTPFWLEEVSEAYPLILLGFGDMDENQIKEGVALLNEAWFD